MTNRIIVTLHNWHSKLVCKIRITCYKTSSLHWRKNKIKIAFLFSQKRLRPRCVTHDRVVFVHLSLANSFWYVRFILRPRYGVWISTIRRNFGIFNVRFYFWLILEWTRCIQLFDAKFRNIISNLEYRNVTIYISLNH